MIIHSSVLDLYDNACSSWVARVPDSAPYLTPITRPSLAPATITPYGHRWLAWISGADTARPVIHLPAGNSWRQVQWENGFLKPASSDHALESTLRHELAHRLQYTMFGDRKGKANPHIQDGWIAAIGAWHADEIESMDNFIRRMERRKRNMKRVLSSYDFPFFAPQWVISAGSSAPDTAKPEENGLYVMQCIVCADDFTSRRSDKKTCSNKCRMKLSRLTKEVSA